MSTTIEIKGNYKQTFEPFPGVRWHHEGPFDLTKALGTASWSQTFGIVTLTEAFQDGKVTVSVSAFGLSEPLIRASVVGGKHFRLELDRGNVVEGEVTVKSSASGALKNLAEGDKVTL